MIQFFFFAIISLFYILSFDIRLGNVNKPLQALSSSVYKKIIKLADFLQDYEQIRIK